MGTFTDGSTAQQAFVSQETNGVWEVPRKCRGAQRGGPREYRDLVSRAGSCTAEGSYTDSATIVHTFVLNR